MRPAAAVLIALLVAGCDTAPPAPRTPAPAEAVDDSVRARVADAQRTARLSETAGDMAAAERAWERVLADDPDNPSALYDTARLRAARGDGAGALERLERLRAVEPGASRGLLLAATLRMDPATGAGFDLAAAEALVRAALDRNPEESGPHRLLAELLWLRLASGEATEEETVRRLEIASRMNPRDAVTRSLLGVHRLRAGERDPARAAFRAALRARSPAADSAGLPGEGDTLASLDADRLPGPGELRALAGLAALGDPVGHAAPGPAPDAGLRAAVLDRLRRRGTGEALLDRDCEAEVAAAVVELPGTLGWAVRRGTVVTLHREARPPGEEAR